MQVWGSSSRIRSKDRWYPPAPYEFFAGIRSVNYGTLDNVVTLANGNMPGGGGYSGGVLLQDGRVFCTRGSFGTTAGIYNPATDSWATPGGTFPEGNELGGGATLLKDGRVFILPATATSALIYDPVADTTTTLTNTSFADDSFSDMVMMRDGRIFIAPTDSPTAEIYDPVADKIVIPSGTYPTGISFMGVVLMTDGRVFCVPSNAEAASIYDPITDTVTTTANNTFPGNGRLAHRSGVLLLDGRVLCVPYSTPEVRIYDPRDGSVKVTAQLTNDQYTHGVLMPDGNVFISPSASSHAIIYNPYQEPNVLTPTADKFPGGEGACSGVVLRDGRIFCVPAGSSAPRIYGNPLPQPLPWARVLNSYDNHC